MGVVYLDILKNIKAYNLLHALSEIEDISLAKFFILDEDVSFLYVCEDEILLVKYDFLLNENQKEQCWLADEESFNGEIPLYFSEATHRKSPAYLLQLSKNKIEGLEYNGKTYSIRFLRKTMSVVS